MEEKRKRSRKVIEEEYEEQKVEMFFALIRSTRDASDRLRKIADDHNHHDHRELKEKDQKVMKKAPEDHDEKPPIWTPAFEWEDFTEGTTTGQSIKARRTMNLVNCTGSSLSQRSGTRAAKEEGEDGLDLKLSL